MTIQHAAITVTLIYIAILLPFAFPRRKVNRRNRHNTRLQRQVIRAPWDGAIVKPKRYYVSEWSAAIGRLYREMR